MEAVKDVAPRVSGMEDVEEGRGGVSVWEIKKMKLSVHPDPAFSGDCNITPFLPLRSPDLKLPP